MGQVVVSLAAMFASLALFITGTGLLGTVLAIQLTQQGYSASVVGFVLVCHSLGFVVGTRMAIHVIARVGQVRSFAAFAAVGCVAALLHLLWINGWLWAVLRGATGFCAAGLIMVLESWISGRATRESCGALLGIYQVVYFFAAALGRYLVAVGRSDDYPIYPAPRFSNSTRAPSLSRPRRPSALHRPASAACAGCGVSRQLLLGVAFAYAGGLGNSVTEDF